MLLTSSQVSVLISSGIIILCTFALFLSGYVIQQRTLRDLREAIRPNRIPRPSPKIYPPDEEQLSSKKRPAAELDDGTKIALEIPGTDDEDDHRQGEVEEDVIVVRPTIPEEVEGSEQKPIVAAAEDKDSGAAAAADDTILEKQRTWDGVSEDGKQISRAERRRRIKEEIQRLSQGETPVYYQRRLW
ncbi:hypothetical protein F5X99DRAFT_331800 [Biscogniauxia marginata]|nr:hypothetical protein F5X99DRAFT_331800 [Biscogniauxia marginata]